MDNIYINRIGDRLRTVSLRVLSTCMFSVSLTLAGCGDFLEEYSQDLSRVQTADDLNELLMGDCTMPLGLFSNNNSYYQYENTNYMVLHFMGDELQENLQISSDPDRIGARSMFYPYFTWQQNCFVDYEGSSVLEADEETYWNLGYEKINNCNMVIDAGEQMRCGDSGEDALRLRVLGECYFLRATYYFVLANLYGKPYSPATADSQPCVPLKLSPSVDDVEFRRNTVGEVYAQILSDLDMAEDLLASSATAGIYHAGITAVYIFRSRVHLFMQEWEEVRRYARLALDKNDALQDLRNFGTTAYPISASNPEVVYSNGASCLGNMLFQAPGKRGTSVDYMPVYCVSDHLKGLYEADDARLTTYLTTRADLYARTCTYHKIDCSTASYGKYKEVSDVFCLRTAEAYLNIAEAEARLGNDAVACDWLDKLRQKRVVNAARIGESGSRLVTFIREERERELCLEGHRWFDLRRYQVDNVYPYSKIIEHTMTWYKSQGAVSVPSYTRFYRLEQNDDAYTLNIPKSVRDFQNSIGSNPRPDRQPFAETNY
ncbi:MAG: RagB/SusD family nutrient uptake outer membrane protein [Bacteroides sp.]|nr:RagB/SusD family nutrient uptake outer membrane protein [Roseburia sp.]MCM1347014.1 RagB/SusD family nutrient uptake outer membrane protein [Bacteroides sp.]MCM1421533.1 RagB/SusD family nutrient uptake outer membrane protein [Bacteroides sp.]